MLMFSRCNVFHVHLVQHANICQLAQIPKVQLRLMGMSLVSHVFGHVETLTQ